MTVLAVVFWVAAALLVYTQVGYGVLLELLSRLLRSPAPRPGPTSTPTVALIVAAHDEAGVIEAKVANALALLYPRDLLQVVVACDGCSDDTAARARAAGADLVLELPRGGKIRAQDAAVAATESDVVAFSDANSLWRPDALTLLAAAFADHRVGYACGQVRFSAPAGATNQEGAYWRYEMALRERESALCSVTAGNGAIYATRRDAYLVVDPVMGHDLSLPFNVVKRGRRAIYVPEAVADEKMVPSVEGEFARKRRMMSHTWPIVLRGGMLSPRGYGPLYALMMFSHRVLRYSTPFLHVVAFGASLALIGESWVYALAVAAQAALLLGAIAARAFRARLLLIARYYVLTTASVAAGMWDWLRHGTDASWEAAEGTR